MKDSLATDSLASTVWPRTYAAFIRPQIEYALPV